MLREAGTRDAVQRSTVHDVLRSGGRPLDDATRTDMEARLGADFSDVRVHTGAAATASAAGLGARAYTSGDHVVLGAGGGDRLTLAHELTHVIQQRQGPVAGTDTGSGLRVSDPGDRFEREAEATARRVMATTPGTTVAHEHAHGYAAAVIQRAPYKQVSQKAAQRLALAEQVVNEVKALVPQGGNQRYGLMQTLMNSRMRYMVMSKAEFWDGVPPGADPADLTVAKAQHARGGNCSEQAVMAFSLLRQKASHDRIRMVNVIGVDHAFVLIGDDNEGGESDWAVADPWPVFARACLWEDHFLNAPFSELNLHGDVMSNGGTQAPGLAQQIRLNWAGQYVVNWSLATYQNMTGADLAAVLQRNGYDIDPMSFTPDEILEGVDFFNAETGLQEIIDMSAANQTFEPLSLWCLAEVGRPIVRTIAQSVQPWQATPQLVYHGTQDGLGDEPEHEVWNQLYTTNDAEGITYYL
ncbi:DUF4157 domain-containing protein [Actinomadura graeca]|uniref:eCIS core domain-containing protein n=1 Tax=Actinomadura graeca TaxID=2750812 RepID=UPI001E378D4A|nr:DUF4157 domain-containing protein [Actinomadura graeca]